VTVNNSIVAQNIGFGCSVVGGTLTTVGASFDDDGTCSPYGFSTDPSMFMGSLQGSPPSYPIYPPSAGVNAAACVTNYGGPVTEDQIGFPRPFNNVTPEPIAPCDSGAREWDGSFPP
jgi:hypothetical protein